MSIKSRIEAYTGTQTESLTDKVKQSVARVIELVPREQMSPYMTLMSNISEGASVAGKKVVSVSNDGKQILETERAYYSNPASIYYAADSRDTVYWLSGSMIYSLPEDADCEVIDYSGVTESDTQIGCLPPQFTEAVVLDVAIGKLMEKMYALSLLALDVDSTTATLPSTLASFSESFPAQMDASAAHAPTYFSVGLTTSLTGLATPSVTLAYPAALGSLTLVWADIAQIASNYGTDITTGLSLLQTMIADLKTEVTEQLAPNSEDIELGMAKLNQLKTALEEYVSRADMLFRKIMADSDIDKLNRVKQYEFSIETAHNELQKFSANLGFYQTRVQLLLAEHKENIDLFQSVSGFELATYKTVLERYSTLIQADLGRLKNNLDLWQADQSAAVAKYQIEVLARAERYKEYAATVAALQQRFVMFFEPFQAEKKQ